MPTAGPASEIARAADVKALVDALRSIPAQHTPVKRARTVALREQIYHGYEVPLARGRGGAATFGKYEHDRHWSRAARDAVRSGKPDRGDRSLNRDHVVPAAYLVDRLLEATRTVEETAALLNTHLVTCTVLAREHSALGRVPQQVIGWARYDLAGIAVLRTFDNESPCVDEACGHGRS